MIFHDKRLTLWLKTTFVLMRQLLFVISLIGISLSLSGCFTGVETTKKITDKDVARAMQELDRGKTHQSFAPYVDSLPTWRQGKEFIAVDEQLRLIFSPSALYDIDTMSFKGKHLSYDNYTISRRVDNSEEVIIHFTDGANSFAYPTGHPLSYVSSPSFTIPFLVDNDMIEHYSRLLVGKTLYVKTAIWYDSNGDMKTGRKFVPVEVTNVNEGNKVYPLRVSFVDKGTGESAMLWMTTDASTIVGRDFDSLFALNDIRQQYPNIDADIWPLIVAGKVTRGMKKDECRLSLGTPQKVNQLPDQTGLREYWYYDGGRYLYFVDGVLQDFR